MKIAIGLPTNRGVKPRTAESLLQMVVHTKLDYHFIVSTKGYHTAENRTYIVVQALNNGCTHLLLVDDDMIYEPDTLEKLLAHDTDIVGGLYKTRYENSDYLIEEKDGEVLALGGGCLLIKTDVFRKIPPLWFGYKYYENGMVSMSNDWYFCEKARNAGYTIYVDRDVRPKHIGKYEF